MARRGHDSARRAAPAAPARAPRAGKFRRISAEQFVANMMGLLIFPFAIRPALCELLVARCRPAGARFLEERRRFLPDFFMAGLGHDPPTRPRGRRARSRRPAGAAQDTLHVERLQEAALRATPGPTSARCCAPPPTSASSVIAADRLPQLEINGQATHQSDVTRPTFGVPGITVPDFPKDRWQTTLDVEQRLYDGGDVARRRELEEARHAESEAAVDVALYQLRSDVNSAFFSAFLFEKRSAEYDALVADLDARLAAVRARVEAGTALGRDAAEIEAERVRAGLQRDEARASRRAALATLADLVGQPIDTTAVLVLPSDEPERTHPADLAAVAALRRRPEFEQLPPVPRPARPGGGVHLGGEPAQGVRLRPGRRGAAGTGPVPHLLGRLLAGGGARSSGGPGPGAPRGRKAAAYRLQQDVVATEEKALGRRLARAVVTDLEDIGRLKAALADDERIVALRDRGRTAGAGPVRRRRHHHAGLRRDAHRRPGSAADTGAPPGRAGPGAVAVPHHPGAHAPHSERHAMSPAYRRRFAPSPSSSAPSRWSPAAARTARRLRQLRGDRGDGRGRGRGPAARLRPGGGRPHREATASSAWWTRSRWCSSGRRWWPGGRGAAARAREADANIAALEVQRSHRRARAGPHRAAAPAGGGHRAAGRPRRARGPGGAGAAGRRARGARDGARRKWPRSTPRWRRIDDRLARSRIASPLAGTVLARYVGAGGVRAGRPAAVQAGLARLAHLPRLREQRAS